MGSGICEAMEVPLIVKKSRRDSLEDLECYTCSRERRTLLFQAAKEHNINVVAFGHHQDE